jgi:hypothetical protein
MKESPSNIGFVCPDHAPKPDAQYFDKPFDWFMGKFCKLGFPTNRKEAPFTEFMWVHVCDHDGEFLVGNLNNDPVYVTEYKDGDGVAFVRNEICDVE